MRSRSQDPDREDVLRVRSGDVDAFEGIVRRWQGPLVNLAYRFCRDSGRAEEMAQEAFLRIFRNLGRWRDDALFSTWLFAVATNLYRSELRRIRPREVELDPERDVGISDDPTVAIEWEETAEQVRRTVATLPEKFRDVMVLFYFQEMDLAETARTLGLREGTVKARLHRGRDQLRRRLTATVRAPVTAEAT